MTREGIQGEALQAAKDNNYNGVICLSPGTGKSKVAIDCIKQGNFKNILITSPRTNLKKSWIDELFKWGEYAPGHRGIGASEYSTWIKGDGFDICITLENIQTCYKWGSENFVPQMDFIIFDEIHTCGEEYFSLISMAREYNIPVLGLTGTPTLSDPWKKEVLYKALPIIYEYYDSEKDGITNKINYQVYEYELDNNHKVVGGSKLKPFYIGEAKQYAYLSDNYEKAKTLMFLQGASNYFEQSLDWMRNKNATKEQQEAGRKFFNAIRARKEFLWNLSSSKEIALQIKTLILNGYYIKKIDSEWCCKGFEPNIKKISRNKVLLFSELTAQAERLSPYSIHSNNGKNAKEIEANNKALLERFNKGEIRELSSCLSLTLGLNMVGCTHAIFESYSSSNTNAIQKSKRLARLGVDEIANVIIIKAKNTQMESWFNEAFKDIEHTVVTDLKDLKI